MRCRILRRTTASHPFAMNSRRRHELTWLPTIATTSLSKSLYATAIARPPIATNPHRTTERRLSCRFFITTLSTADLVVGRRQPGRQSACHDDVALARLLGPAISDLRPLLAGRPCAILSTASSLAEVYPPPYPTLRRERLCSGSRRGHQGRKWLANC